MYDLAWKNDTLWTKLAGSTSIPPPPKDIPISKAALLLWMEHCIECAPPECYLSCSLYVPRRDQKCARFVYGIFPNDQVKGLFEYGGDILLRRWAKIEANLYGNTEMLSIETLRKYDRWGDRLGIVANYIGDLLQQANPKRRVNGLYTLLRSKWVERRFVGRSRGDSKIDGFYMKFFYPGQERQELQLELFQNVPVYRSAIPVSPGWNETFIPFSDMGVIPDRRGRISLWAANDAEMRLIFTWLDFVTFEDNGVATSPRTPQTRTAQRKPAAKVKCLVWDLDNTLWAGVIGDVGPENVRPNEKAIDLIQKLDERGVIQSIASKNTYEIAWSKIEQLGLADYFLYPAIHWGPKSESVRNIARALNINVDTLALIDDSPFERAETMTVLPQVRTYDACDIDKLLSMDEFDVPVTEASRQRRLSYLSEAKRKQIAATWSNDLEGFLRSCGMVMQIGFPRETQRDRCFELIQRTNQLNLSARRFSMHEFDSLLRNKTVECYVFNCTDKYGDYGLVGFASADVGGSAPVIRDFVLSCRVAQKKVEETFLYWYARKVQQRGADRLIALLVRTERNEPLREVLARLPFREVSKDEDTQLLEFIFDGPVWVPDIIRVIEV